MCQHRAMNRPDEPEMEPNNRRSNPKLRPAASVLLRLYKLTLSPMLALFGARCRYHPTCSEYAAGAVSVHGVWPGAWMALARLSRCHPLGQSGIDEVPQALPARARWYAPWRYGVWRT